VRITEKNLHYQRAKKLFLRSKSYLLRAFEILHPQTTFLLQTDKTDSVLSMVTLADTSLLFWTASAWMGAFMCDKFDMSLAVDIPKPVAFMHKLLAMNETFGNGSVHDFFISYYGGMPESMGGSEEKARQHFRRSVELSQGWAASPYVALASTLCVAKQDIKEFKTLMQQALAIDVDKNISNRLANIISQNKARWMLDHRDNYFLDIEPAGGEKQQ
jgi:predicted anti-sigma-YlaC factor YlaD